jgi:hypothetical protein
MVVVVVVVKQSNPEERAPVKICDHVDKRRQQQSVQDG